MTPGRKLDLLAIEAFTWTPTLETACEICLGAAESGRQVGFAFLDIENVDHFPPLMGHRFGSWMYAAGRPSRMERVRTVETILRSRAVTVIQPRTGAKPAALLSCRDLGIDSIESLRAFRPGGAALGLGVLSTLVRLSGDSAPDFDSSRPLIDRILNSACQAFDLARDLIDTYRPDTVLLYNGRFAVAKAISEAARLSGAGVLYHELASTHDRHFLSSGAVHDLRSTRRQLHESWATAGPDKVATATQYFQPERGGIRLFETQFLGYQQRDKMIEPTGRWRIVYFVSSIDEFAAVEYGFENPLFESQQIGAEWLASWVRSRPEMELIIRMHPRGRALSVREMGRWAALAGTNVTVLQAESPVNSYGLATSADRVVAHHSSMGVESTYLGKVSILVGDADYRGLDCVYEPSTTEELADMLGDNGLSPKPKENCLPYGYQRLTRGEKYRFYQPASFQEGSFFGERVIPDKEERIVARTKMAVLRRLHRLVDRQQAETRRQIRR